MNSIFENHLFFSKLNDNTILPENFVNVIAPFYYIVYMWPIHLKNYSKLIKGTTKSDKLLPLICENINTEYGIINNIQYLDKIRSCVFINFLHKFGFNQNLLTNDAVNNFNNKLKLYMDQISLEEFSYVLGTIELLYVDISKIIIKYSKQHYIDENYFSVYKTESYKNANNFFEISYNLNITQDQITLSSNRGYQLLNEVFELMYKQNIENKC